MLLDYQDIYGKNKNKLENHYKKVLSDISGIDAFDKNGNKLAGKYSNIIIDIPREEAFDKKGNKVFKKGGVYKRDDTGKGEKIYD